jgi:hypothetical protein
VLEEEGAGAFEGVDGYAGVGARVGKGVLGFGSARDGGEGGMLVKCGCRVGIAGSWEWKEWLIGGERDSHLNDIELCFLGNDGVDMGC